ncbi:MAG: transglutaminase domain-containing protein [Clostridia bacterium]|nr:transglutaminase domain-containing protein [Clostridia bacterium]
MKDRLSHGLLSVLLGAGLILPILGALGLMSGAPMAMALLMIVTALLLAGSLHRLAQAGVAAAIIIAGAVWLFVAGGLQTCLEVLNACALQLSGLPAALPLFAGETAALLGVVTALLAWPLTSRRAGYFPALALLLLSATLLWLSGSESLLPCLTPALAAVITLVALANHDELPMRRVLPMAVIASAVAMLLTPAGGVSIPPLKEAADKLRQTIYDHLFFTEQRSVFSLANEGYYPQGAGQLGGKAEPTDHPVMLVATPRKVYLRGVTKNEYTGRTWLSTTGGRRYLWISSRWSDERTSLFNMDLPAGKLSETAGLLTEQTVTVQLLDSNASTMFVPQRIRSLSPGGDLVPYFNNASEVFATRDLQAGDTYTVSAPLMVSGDAGLATIINACARYDDPAYDGIAAMYTQLPDHLQQMVFDLARKAAEGAQTPYEQAFALQNYLSRSFRYTLDAPEQPGNIDFVTNFLLSEKEGYCTHFASAMTVLCRMLGLPARYVEGYIALPDETGVAHVTGLQGHAWTEVYFHGFGWVTFDATPGQSNSGTQPQSDPPPEEEPDDQQESPEEPDPPPAEQPEDEPEPPEAPDDPENPPADPPVPPNLAWLWWLLLLAAIAAAAVRIVLTQPERLAKRAETPEDAFAVWAQAAQDALLVRRLPRQKSESPMAYAARLDAQRTLPVSMQPLGRLLAMVYYGRIVPEPAEIGQARHIALCLINDLQPHWRAAVHLIRAFVPMKYRDFAG